MPTKAQPQADSLSSEVARPPARVDVERFRADLREGGVEDMFDTLLNTFVQDCPLRFAALEQAVLGGDAKAIERAAHAFKSGAGTVRATFLAEGLNKAEAAGRTGNLELVSGLLEQIRGEYLAVVREVGATPQQ